MRANRQSNTIHIRAFKRRAFFVLAIIVTILISVYVVLLALSIKNVVLRKEAEIQMRDLRAQVASMEREYIVRVGDITESRATGAGLGKVASKSFTERRVLVGQAN
jgi:hypothetical protein